MKKIVFYLFVFIVFLSACKSKHIAKIQAELVQKDIYSGVSEFDSIIHGALFELDKKVRRGGNSAEGQERVKRAVALTKDVELLFEFIDSLQNDLEKKVKAKPQSQSSIIREFMLGKAQNAKKLKRNLDNFVQYLYHNYLDLGFKKINNDFPKLMELDNLTKAQTNNSFTELHFKTSTWTDTKNFFQNIKYRVLTYKGMIFKKLGADNLTRSIRDDFFWNFAQTNSNQDILPVNEYYEGQLFFNYPRPISHEIRQVWINGEEFQRFGDDDIYIKINPNKAGQFIWKAKVKMRLDLFRDTTFYITKKYKVIP